MKKIVRTLDFYGFDDGCLTKEGSNFLHNKENKNRDISKDPEAKVVNRIGK